MRKEIEPVSATEFMKFLLAWQQVTASAKPRGRDGVLQVIRQLQGLELPATAWEQHVLPARVAGYDPADLEHLCLAGVVAWGRLRSDIPATEEPVNDKRRRRNRRAPGRSAPLAFLLREDRDHFFDHDSAPSQDLPGLSAAAREVADYLRRHGASFVSDIARHTGLLRGKAEESLWELVARGVATGDGIAGLRMLLTPEKKRHGRRSRLRIVSAGEISARAMPLGRWSLWRDEGGGTVIDAEARLEHRARQLLARYGVMFRELLARETCAPSWRHLLQTYRRLEARGEIRGGRFVNGFAGEQFALPQAVDRLRAQRRLQETEGPVVIAAADPLNLVGILSPGARLSPYSNQSIVYADGTAVETGPLGALLGHLHRRRETVAP